MKYIKKFNESDNKDGYYTKIPLSDLTEYCENGDVISISQQNIEYLKSIFINWHIVKDLGTINSSNGMYKIDFIRLNTKLRGTKIGTIDELKDEYFIVYLSNENSYYLCDQIDGVEELLKEKNPTWWRK